MTLTGALWATAGVFTAVSVILALVWGINYSDDWSPPVPPKLKTAVLTCFGLTVGLFLAAIWSGVQF